MFRQWSEVRVDDGQELRRVRWRSRRGMLELDLFLVPFAEHRYADLTPAERSAYRRLLDREDWEILDWLRQDSTPAPELAGIVELVREGTKAND